MGVRGGFSVGNGDNGGRRRMNPFGRRSRGTSDGVRTLELKTSKDDDDENGRKVRVALGKSKGRSSGGGVRILEPKKRLSGNGRSSRGSGVDFVSRGGERSSRRVERDSKRSGVDFVSYGDEKSSRVRGRRVERDSERSDVDFVSCGGGGEKSSRARGRRVEKDSKRKNGDEDDGRKRKRGYDDSNVVEERLSDSKVKTRDGRSSARIKEEVDRVNLDKGNEVVRGKATEYEDSPKCASVTRRKKIESEMLDTKSNRGKLESAGKLKRVQGNDLGNGLSKGSDKKKATLTTSTHLDQRKLVINSVGKPRRNNVRGKKSLVVDSDSKEDPPKKKKKRVIRIDRYDTSNKRLDDSMDDNGKGQEKNDLDETNDVEMSKNAQFRAICPSPSILSFVEDNLLGRRRDIEFRRAGYNTELSAPLDNIPFSTSSERERIEVPAFRNKLEFFAAAKVSSSFPPAELPEIAFAGRSNVGKSSLLNSLTRQWGVVRTSDKPGLTQTINFFKLGSKLCLVDLPGYGFAYAKEEVKEAWEELVKEYVASRVGLKRVCLLVDTKWGMKPRDYELIDLMERSQTKYQIVLTKTDLVFPIDVARRAMQIEEQLKAKKSAVQPLMMVSSKTGAGIRSLRTVLANVARFVRR